MKISKTDGTIDFATGRIQPALDRPAFLATTLGRTATIPLQNAGWTHYDIWPEPGIAATLLYDGDQLDRVILMMDTPSDRPDQWSEQVELERKRDHDVWLRRELGEAPNRYDWGRVVSDYDARSCASNIIVYYRRRPGSLVPEFPNQVGDAFAAAIGSGLLAIESSMLDAEAFGNAAVVLAGGNVRIRVIRDRDETFADAASRLDPENWYPLQRVIRAVGAPSPPEDGLLAPADAAQLVERHFADLDRGLAAGEFDRTRKILGELGEHARERFLSRYHSRHAES